VVNTRHHLASQCTHHVREPIWSIMVETIEGKVRWSGGRVESGVVEYPRAIPKKYKTRTIFQEEKKGAALRELWRDPSIGGSCGKRTLREKEFLHGDMDWVGSCMDMLIGVKWAVFRKSGRHE